MKKALAALMLAAMILSAGCGNTMDGAKKDAQDAAQKVEQKADEVKQDAAAKVEEVKDKAGEVKDEAAAKVDDVKSGAENMAGDAANKLEEVTAEMTQAVEGRTVALSGVMPGSSIEDVQAMFGEATSVDGNTMTFADGLKVVLDGANKVKSISTIVDTFETPEGMYVGASEYSLNDNCGPADSVRKIANGAEYEYNSGDKKSIVVYKAENGIITEITCTLK